MIRTPDPLVRTTRPTVEKWRGCFSAAPLKGAWHCAGDCRDFKDNKLFPTSQDKIYSFRHAFENRMKEGGLNEELRRILMGTPSIVLAVGRAGP